MPMQEFPHEIDYYKTEKALHLSRNGLKHCGTQTDGQKFVSGLTVPVLGTSATIYLQDLRRRK